MSVSLSPIFNGYQSFLTNGLPNNGGFIYTYAAGTNTLTPTYTTSAGNIANTNPIQLSTSGTPPQEIWLTDGTAYKLVVTDATTAPIANGTFDNITGIGSAVLGSNLASSIGSSLIGFIQAGIGAIVRTLQSKLRDTISTKDFGVVGDGVADDTVAFNNARTAALGRTLMIYGTPLITSQLIISQKEYWKFDGAKGNYSGNLPASYLKKGAAMTTSLVQVLAQGALFEGGGLVGVGGNTGDGLQILGNSFTARDFMVNGMGNDGIRIGDSGSTYYNADSFLLDGCTSSNNGRHGININGQAALTDANAGLLIKPFCQSNGGNGINSDYAHFGNVILCPLLEANTGYGLYLETHTTQCTIIGGDIEANTITAQIYDGNATTFANRFIDVCVAGNLFNNRLQSSTFTPVIQGASSAGTATYSVQQGSYSISGSRCSVEISLTWTGHTGTGQMQVPLPFSAQQNNPINGKALPIFFPANFLTAGITITSPAQPAAEVNTTNNIVSLYTNNAGTLTTLPVSASGTVYLSFSYTLLNNLAY